MKTKSIIFWVSTAILFLTQGVGTAIMLNNPESAAGFKQLGYPEYFRIMLSIFKIAGSIVLIIPIFKGKLREWAYAGFGFDFIAAAVSIWATAGFGPHVLFAFAFMGILIASYISNQKINSTP